MKTEIIIESLLAVLVIIAALTSIYVLNKTGQNDAELLRLQAIVFSCGDNDLTQYYNESLKNGTIGLTFDYVENEANKCIDNKGKK